MKRTCVTLLAALGVAITFLADTSVSRAEASALLADQSALQEKATTAPASTHPAATQPMPDAQAVIDRYIEVTGGQAAYDSITSRHLEADYVIADLGIRGTMVADLRADGKAKVTFTIPDLGSFEQGLNDGVVWANDQTNGPRILSGKDAAAMRQMFTFAPEISLAEYASAKVTEVVDLNGVATYKMVLHNATIDADETRYYDIKTGFLVRSDSSLITQDTKIDLVTRYGDYEDVAPIRMPMKTRQSTAGLSPEQQNTKVVHNIEIADDVFALPAEVIEVQKQAAATQPVKP